MTRGGWVALLTMVGLFPLVPTVEVGLAQSGNIGGTIGKRDKTITGDGLQAPTNSKPRNSVVRNNKHRTTSNTARIAGRWKWNADCGSFGKHHGDLQISQTDDGFTGVITTPGSGPQRVYDGKINGNAISFVRESPEGRQDWNGAIAGARMRGSLAAVMGIRCTWTASR